MIPNDRKAPVQSGLPPAPGYPDSSNPSGTGIRLSSHGTRNLAGNLDSPQTVIFITSIIDEIAGDST